MFFKKVEQPTGFVPNPEHDEDPRNLTYEEIAPFAGQDVPESGDVEVGDWTLDQGHSLSCTCHSTAYVANQIRGVKLSPRFAYHVIKTDPKYPSSKLNNGAYMLDSVKLLCDTGFPLYSMDVDQNTQSDESFIKYTPDPNEFVSAQRNKGGSYLFVATGSNDLDKFDQIVRYLNEQKQPVKVGMQWRGSFNEARKTGIVPTQMPTGSIAGHDMMAVAWKKINNHEYLGFRNSFGPTWGDKGRIWLPKGFFKIQTSIAYLAPEKALEVKIEPPVALPANRDYFLEKSCAQNLRKMLYDKFPINVAKGSQDANYRARALAGQNWLVLPTAVAYRGWTITDVTNWLYTRSRDLKKEPAYSFDFTKNK